MEFDIEDVSQVKEMGQEIAEQLYAFNFRTVPADFRPICFAARKEGELIGGVCANRFGNTAYVEILWVREDMRRKGIGRALLSRAEEEARGQGASMIWLDTFDFQAPDYYPELGYREFGRLEDTPIPGHSRLFLKKDL